MNRSPDIFFRDTVEVIAHRGGSAAAPENTLPAFDCAVALGPDVVLELDVRLSADGRVVVIHDGTLDRTTDGTGPVIGRTAAELQTLDAGYHFRDGDRNRIWRGGGARIPLLSEVLARYPRARMLVEVKGYSPRLLAQVLAEIRSGQAQERIVLCADDHRVIGQGRRREPSWRFAASRRDVLRTMILSRLHLTGLDRMPADLYSIPERHGCCRPLTARLQSEVQRRGKKLFIWTVNTEADMVRLLRLGVDGLVTDRPALLQRLLADFAAKSHDRVPVGADRG